MTRAVSTGPRFSFGVQPSLSQNSGAMDHHLRDDDGGGDEAFGDFASREHKGGSQAQAFPIVMPAQAGIHGTYHTIVKLGFGLAGVFDGPVEAYEDLELTRARSLWHFKRHGLDS